MKFLPAVVGLVNSSDVGCSSASALWLLTEPGQLKLYGIPSKSPSVFRHSPDLHEQRGRSGQAEDVIAGRVLPGVVRVVGVRAERLQARGERVRAHLGAVLTVPGWANPARQ